MISLAEAILRTPPERDGVLVEAGCFRGGSTAKLSVVAKIVNRRLMVFDSFQGLPHATGPHDRNIFGGNAAMQAGDYSGQLEEVKRNVDQYGEIEVCQFFRGWFEETMPQFQAQVAGAFVDVDLASSTRTCLQHLYPKLSVGGFIFSHDGHLPLCIQVFEDADFWGQVAGEHSPVIEGLGQKKLIRITKPAVSA